ncbi:hypothetical protein GCM10025865_24680 [Paraoerskovia sediminicola]|uniref:Sortase family protein n=1 Tax=Paraoerskovia sediminicola TaxID=1138587 RepID=A0ABM8G4Y1_9CELL|nr:class F sortase [Paraoerskovia sediminicola]BDZ43169.1 hypothetical protein GCM10025865_24680 [Paraoerskovia sediminicola]
MAPDARHAGSGPPAGRRADRQTGTGPAGGTDRRARPGRPLLVAFATVLLVGGGGAVAVGLATQDPAPPAVDPAAGLGPSTGAVAASSEVSSAESSSTGPDPATFPSTGSRFLDGSVPEPDAGQAAEPAEPAPEPTTEPEPAKEQPLPATVRIPSIEVESDLVTMGQADDGTIEVPGDEDVSVVDDAAWYDGSPRPGAAGPSVILGHVDSINGPSVFHDLAAVAKGDTVFVDREDGTTAEFVVDHVETYPKNQFPTAQVYRNTDDPELRVITCGGDIDPDTGHYADNTVVYAHQV